MQVTTHIARETQGGCAAGLKSGGGLGGEKGASHVGKLKTDKSRMMKHVLHEWQTYLCVCVVFERVSE